MRLPLLAATLTVCALASAPVLAQTYSDDAGASIDSATGGYVYVLPANVTGYVGYRADWIYRNLDSDQVVMYRSRGYTDGTIKCAANIAMRADVPMDNVLNDIMVGGYPLNEIAEKYNLSMRDVTSEIPGYGAVSMSFAPHEIDHFTMPVSTSYQTTWTPAATTSAPTITNGDIIAVLSGDPRFSTLASLIRSAGLEGQLQQTGPWTLFAPTDDAFAKLSATQLNSLMQPQNQAQLRTILLYHLIGGSVSTAQIRAMTAPYAPASLQGAALSVTNNGVLQVNGASIVAPDMQALNGVIHGIDTVLMPPATVATPAPMPAPTAP